MMYLDSSILILYSILIFCLFALPKFIKSYTPVTVDWRAKVVISTYFISAFLSAINWIYYNKCGLDCYLYNAQTEYLVELVDLVTVEFLVLNLQLIVFEMLSLYYTLTSQSKEQNDKYQKRVAIFKYFVLVSTILSLASSVILTIIHQPTCELVKG